MQIFSYHLVKTSPVTTVAAMCRAPSVKKTPGLLHMECMAAMALGAPILSPERMQLRNLAVFAAWESNEALDKFLAETKLGQTLSEGWHVRLELLRRWGQFPELDKFPANAENTDADQPVVAVTLAKLKLPHLFRFIRWGKPVEEQVRDHPSTSLALATLRLPRTFSTFSIWRTQKEMTEMVHGKGSSPKEGRHAEAMAERSRKDFHHKFTTLRFRATAEHGEWAGRSDFIPK